MAHDRKLFLHVLAESRRSVKSVAALCREAGIPLSRFYRWRRRFRSVPIENVLRLEAREEESRRIRRVIRKLDRALLRILRRLLSAAHPRVRRTKLRRGAALDPLVSSRPSTWSRSSLRPR